MKEPMSISLPASPASHSQPELMACEPSPCAKPTPDAKPSLPKRGRESQSGRTLEPSAWPTPAAQTAGISEDIIERGMDDQRKYGKSKVQMTLDRTVAAAWPTPREGNDGSTRTPNGNPTKDGLSLSQVIKEASGSLPLAFPANQPHGPGSKEARLMTVGSGQRLARSLLPSDPLGPFSRILLASETWASPEFYLTWDVKATQCGSLVWELAPSAPRIGECDTGLFASGWPTPQEVEGHHGHRGSSPERVAKRVAAGRQLSLAETAQWPTPRSEDTKSDGPKAVEAFANGTAKTSQMRMRTQLESAPGPTTSGCLARTEKFVVRLTTLSAWLMGYTAAYLALWETRLSGRSPRKSSKP